MTIKKILFSTILFAGVASSAQAQYLKDVYTFSQHENGATARFKGLGNTQTALGGDISSISGNPAGLGFFTRSDAAVSFNYLQNNNSAQYFDKITDTNKGRFGLENAGVVFNFPTQRYNGQNTNEGWLNFNVGIAYNRTSNFRNDLNYEGTNSTSTFADFMTDEAFYSPSGDLALDYIGSKLIAPIPGKTDFFSVAQNNNSYQTNTVIERGDRSETTIAFGSNYSNKFYIGASIGMSSFRYQTSNQFREYGFTKTGTEIGSLYPGSSFADPSHQDYDYTDAVYDFGKNYSQITEGSGIDVKVGFIYKPTSTWNIGFTAKTPTWTSIVDDSSENFFVDYFNDENTNTTFAQYDSKKYNSSTDYNLRTPYRLAVGVTKFFGAGLITADAEFVDHASMRFTMPDAYNKNLENNMNQNIKNTYQAAFNFKVGGEYMFTNILAGRLGFNYNGNPYKDADYTNIAGTAGLGVRFPNGTYIDLAAVHNSMKFYESPYQAEKVPVPTAEIKNKRTNVMLTIGAKF